jgi:hypothetical protein
MLIEDRNKLHLKTWNGVYEGIFRKHVLTSRKNNQNKGQMTKERDFDKTKMLLYKDNQMVAVSTSYVAYANA